MPEEYGEDWYFFGHRDDNDDPRADDPEHYQYCRVCSFVLQWMDHDDICDMCYDEEEELRDLTKPLEDCSCYDEKELNKEIHKVLKEAA